MNLINWFSFFSYYLFEQLTEKTYKRLEDKTKRLRFTFPYPLFAYPIYLVSKIILIQKPTKTFLFPNFFFNLIKDRLMLPFTLSWSLNFFYRRKLNSSLNFSEIIQLDILLVFTIKINLII